MHFVDLWICKLVALYMHILVLTIRRCAGILAGIRRCAGSVPSALLAAALFAAHPCILQEPARTNPSAHP